jgi:polar amino acid transport system substrate-binding protein
MKKIIIIFFIFMNAFVFLSASDIKAVYWGTAELQGFTDKDGSGIYTQILLRIFNEAGIKMEILYMEMKKAQELVEKGKIDFTGGIAKDKKPHDTYIQAKYPIILSRYNAFFHRNSITVWDGINTIKGRKIVLTYYMAEGLGLKKHEVIEVTERKQALQILLSHYADFYIDDEKVMKEEINKNVNLFNIDDYQMENIVEVELYMISPHTERGRQIMEIYEKGTEKLFKSGELKRLYSKYGLLLPKIVITK